MKTKILLTLLNIAIVSLLVGGLHTATEQMSKRLALQQFSNNALTQPMMELIRNFNYFEYGIVALGIFSLIGIWSSNSKTAE